MYLSSSAKQLNVSAEFMGLTSLCACQTGRTAGRRAALKAIDWLPFAERIPPNQRGVFNALKTRSDAIAA